MDAFLRGGRVGGVTDAGTKAMCAGLNSAKQEMISGVGVNRVESTGINLGQPAKTQPSYEIQKSGYQA